MNVYEIVQKKIISQIEEAIENGGTSPWRKPWGSGAPKNFITKKPYRGINYILLQSGSYITFKQIQDLQKKNKNIKLKKGSQSDIVVYWNFIKKEDEEGNEVDFPLLKYYRVFSIQDVEGIEEEDFKTYEHEPIKVAEELMENYSQEVPIDVHFGSERAYYNISSDKIKMPHISQFEHKEEYYATLLHEMVHSTGHMTRFNRFNLDGSMSFGSKSYSKEELVAEIGSNMLMAALNIDSPSQHEENTKAYLYGWLKKIKEDVKLIVTAAQQAQKACDYILEFSEVKEDESELVTA